MLGLGSTVGEPAYELLQMAELFEQGRLHDGFAQLQVKVAAGQDERWVAVEALQDITCRGKAEAAITRVSTQLSSEILLHYFG